MEIGLIEYFVKFDSTSEFLDYCWIFVNCISVEVSILTQFCSEEFAICLNLKVQTHQLPKLKPHGAICQIDKVEGSYLHFKIICTTKAF